MYNHICFMCTDGQTDGYHLDRTSNLSLLESELSEYKGIAQRSDLFPWRQSSAFLTPDN